MLRLFRPWSRLALVSAAACTIPALGLAACSSFSSDGTQPAEDGGSPDVIVVDGTPGDETPATDGGDGGVDAATCDLSKDFGPPDPISPDGPSNINVGQSSDYGAWLTPDEKTIFFASARDTTNVRIYTATRADRTQPFTMITTANLDYRNGIEERPSLSSDRTLMVYSVGSYPRDLWVGVGSANAFTVAKLTGFDTGADDAEPFLTDGNEVFWSVNTGGGAYRINSGQITLPDGGTSGSSQTALDANVNGIKNSYAPVLSADKKTIYFASDRDSNVSFNAIYVATRSSATSTFGMAKPVPNVSPAPPAYDDRPDWISPDGCRLYFHSNRGNGKARIYVSERK